jgi:hypothetical protein
MKDNLTQTKPPEPALLIGIDWADQKHDTYTIDRQGHVSGNRLSTLQRRSTLGWPRSCAKLMGSRSPFSSSNRAVP